MFIIPTLHDQISHIPIYYEKDIHLYGNLDLSMDVHEDTRRQGSFLPIARWFMHVTVSPKILGRQAYEISIGLSGT